MAQAAHDRLVQRRPLLPPCLLLLLAEAPSHGYELAERLKQWGFELPAAVPESLVVISLGALATIFVLVRAISIPDEFFFAGRGVGLWVSLLSAVALIGAGLLQASEEL